MRSNFKKVKVGQLINIEKSLVYGQKISGHFSQGHIDTTAKVKIDFIDKSCHLSFRFKTKDFLNI